MFKSKLSEKAVYFNPSMCENDLCEQINIDFKKLTNPIKFIIQTKMKGQLELEGHNSASYLFEP